MDERKLCSLIEERKDELFSLLSELVKINSESFSDCGNEENCARLVYDYCKNIGLESDIFSPMDLEGFDKHTDYMPGRNLENRYNVVGRYRGIEDKDELMLMAHTDTVVIGDLATTVNGKKTLCQAKSQTVKFMAVEHAMINMPLQLRFLL